MYKTEKNKYLTRKNRLIKIKKQAKGITLIALVVTIIVLLILAGVALNLTIGQNGIFTRANDAVIINENANVYEQLQLVIADYQMEDIQNKTSTNILDKLASNGIINGDNTLNVDTLMGKTMKTGKGSIEDGDIYVLEQREENNSNTDSTSTEDLVYYLIYYNSDKKENNLGLAFENNSSSNNSNVKITISKTPDTNEPTGGVYLKVQSIEGINSTINLNELDISSLSKEQKIELCFILELKINNLSYEQFEILLKYNLINYNDIIEDLSKVEDNQIVEIINELKEKGIETIEGYIILNPNDEFSKFYFAEENEKYTFKVKEIITNKIYENSIDISNIDKRIPFYFVGVYERKIFLIDKEFKPTNFENAYIIYNGEKIDINDCALEGQENKSVDIYTVVSKLERLGKVEDRHDLSGTTQTFEIIKDGVSYFGDALMRWEE